MAEELSDDELLSGSMLGQQASFKPFEFDDSVELIDTSGVQDDDSDRTFASQYGDTLSGRLPSGSERPLEPVDAQEFVEQAAFYILSLIHI